MEQWNGLLEWNNGMDYWNKIVEWHHLYIKLIESVMNGNMIPFQYYIPLILDSQGVYRCSLQSVHADETMFASNEWAPELGQN